MKKPKVIFDTNTLRNVSLKNYLGGRKDLEEIVKIADIIIPRVVLQELEKQKLQSFIDLTNKFNSLKTEFDEHFHEDLNIKIESEFFTQNFDPLLHKIASKESFAYEIIDIDGEYFDKIRKLAIEKKPPFEGKDKSSDKGFKDAIFHFCVLDFLDKNPDLENILVYTKDSLLKESFKNYTKVKIVNSYDEISKFNVEKFLNDYFKTKFDEYINESSYQPYNNLGDILIYENNLGHKILYYRAENEYLYFEIDNNEIVNSICLNQSISDICNDLYDSQSFDETHLVISKILNILNFYSMPNLEIVINALKTNFQVYSTIGFGKTHNLYQKIYDLEYLSDELKKTVAMVLRL